MHDKSFSHLL